MGFDTKIRIILRKDLQQWQALNVTAFLMSGIGGTQNIIGEPYRDGSGVEYLPMSQQPIYIHAAEEEQMHEILHKALEKEMAIAIFTEEIFETFNDEDNRAAVANVKTEDLNLVGIAIRGKKNQVDKLVKNIPLHE